MRVTTCEEEENADDEEEEEEDEDDDDDDDDDVMKKKSEMEQATTNALLHIRSGLLFLRETVSNFALFFSPSSNCCCLCNLLQLRGPHIIFNVILTSIIYLCILI